MFYVAVYLLLASVAFGVRNTPSTARQIYPIVLVFLFLLCAFRFEVGCDWSNYRNQFHVGRSFEGVDHVWQIRDPLWWLLIDLIKRLGLSYEWLNITATLVFFVGLHVLARRQPDRLAFLVLLFPILMVNIGMSGIRQAAAIGFVCMAYVAFVDKRFIKFVAFIFLAAAIHSSAMAFFLLAPLVTGAYTPARLALAALLAVPGTVLIIQSAAADLAISRYVGTGIDAAGAVFRVGLVGLTGLVFFFLLRGPWLKTKFPDYRLVSVGSLGMVALAALLPLSTVIADRMSYYFVPIQAIILARIPFLPLGRDKSVYALLAYSALGLVLAAWIALSSHYQKCYVPYQTWLFGTPGSTYGF